MDLNTNAKKSNLFYTFSIGKVPPIDIPVVYIARAERLRSVSEMYRTGTNLSNCPVDFILDQNIWYRYCAKDTSNIRPNTLVSLISCAGAHDTGNTIALVRYRY
jgi:hypothetical protein